MKHLVVIGTALLLTGAPTLFGRDWLYGRESHVEVLSRASAYTTRDLYREFYLFPEIVRTVFEGLPAIEPSPTLLVIVDNTHTLRSLLPDSYRSVTVTSFFEETRHLDLIVILQERHLSTDQVYNWGFRDYGRKLLRPFSLPPWFQAGAGEILGNIQIQRGTARLGYISSGQIQPVKQAGVIPIADFFSYLPDFSPDEYRREAHYFSQATLLAHYFLFAADPVRRNAFLSYILTAEALLGEEQGFQDAVGLSFQELEHILARYARRDRYSAHRYSLRGMQQPPTLTLESVDPVRERALVARAEIAAGQLDRAYLNIALHLEHNEPVSSLYRSAHFFYLARQQPELARLMAERALELGDQSQDLLRSTGLKEITPFDEVPTDLLHSEEGRTPPP